MRSLSYNNLKKVYNSTGWLTTTGVAMGQLFSFAAIFTVAFCLGYGVREAISRKRRAKAKRRRRFFYEDPSPTNDRDVEKLPVGTEIAKPIDTITSQASGPRKSKRSATTL